MSDFDIDLNNVDPEKIGKGANKFPVGQFHVQVNSFEPWAGKNNDQTVVQFECLASNLPDMEGVQHDEYFSDNDVAMSILLSLTISCRLTTREELKKMKETTGRTQIDWNSLIGRQCIIITDTSEGKNGKTYVNLKRSFDVDDPNVVHVPKNAGYLERFKQMFPGGDAGNGKTNPAPTPAPAGNVSSDNGDDLFA